MSRVQTRRVVGIRSETPLGAAAEARDAIKLELQRRATEQGNLQVSARTPTLASACAAAAAALRAAVALLEGLEFEVGELNLEDDDDREKK